MKSLYSRIDAAQTRATDEDLRGELAAEFHDWLDDRLVQGDVLWELRTTLPDASDEILLSVIAAIGRAVRQP